MMNRSNSAEAYVPSMMTFVGLEASKQQKLHLWDWETDTQNPNTTIPQFTPTTHQTHPFISNNNPFFDCPPPLVNNSFPFCSPEYPAGLIKSEEGGGRIGLNLGQRTYFSSGDGLAIDRMFARSRAVYSLGHQHHHLPPRCQAEGCKADLSCAKHYHRRHKVCEFHSKAAVVIAGGLQQRFCQQCSRFHVLAEFDEAKRSCRRRLADHNRRRRKPQLQATTPLTEDSAPKNLNSTSMEKSKHPPNLATNISFKTNLEWQQGHPNKATHLKNDPSVSLVGDGDTEDVMGWSQSLYQHYQEPFIMMSEEKSSHQNFASSPSSTSNTLFHHQNLFCSTSNEASQSTGAASDYKQTNILHLGQAMFEVDFL